LGIINGMLVLLASQVIIFVLKTIKIFLYLKFIYIYIHINKIYINKMCAIWNDLFDLKVINSKLKLKPNFTKSVISIHILIYIYINTTHIFQFTLLNFSEQRVTCSFPHT
jgi:hypothetical protein